MSSTLERRAGGGGSQDALPRTKQRNLIIGLTVSVGFLVLACAAWFFFKWHQRRSRRRADAKRTKELMAEAMRNPGSGAKMRAGGDEDNKWVRSNGGIAGMAGVVPGVNDDAETGAGSGGLTPGGNGTKGGFYGFGGNTRRWKFG